MHTEWILGTVMVTLRKADGTVLREDTYQNLVTDVGDAYYAAMAIAGVSPASPVAPTKVTGMKVGTGTTSVAKNGSGAAIVTYISASNQAFDATYPQVNNLGAGLGVQAVYQVTYQAGVATSTGIWEAVIVNDAGSNAASTAPNTISRVLFSTAYPKGATDILTINWTHKFLGA